jgi:hypothetical protein
MTALKIAEQRAQEKILITYVAPSALINRLYSVGLSNEELSKQFRVQGSDFVTDTYRWSSIVRRMKF